MSGVIACTGFPNSPPVKAGPAISDFLAGVHLFGGVMAALFDRSRTGQGRLVEVSMLEATFPTLMSAISMWHTTGGKAPLQTGNRHSSLAESPYNVYPAQDGSVAIISVNEQHWLNLCEAMNRPDLTEDARFRTRSLRAVNIDALDALISAWTAGWRRDELATHLNAHHVPNAPVREIGEVMNDEHLHERRSLQWVEHPLLGRMAALDSPIRFEGAASPVFESSGPVGVRTAHVLRQLLGLTEDEIEQLARSGAVSVPQPMN
jgi:formyl-CoA transferase